MISTSALFLVFSSSLALAAPLQRRDAFSDLVAQLTPQGTTPVAVSSADQDTLGLAPAAALASAAYCANVATEWTCKSCAKVPDLQVTFTAGDGEEDPRVFVGYSDSLKAVVVSHEGSEANVDAWTGNLDASLVDLDASLPRAPASVQVHHGFQANYVVSQKAVLDAVQSAVSGVGSSATRLLVVGHSMGGATATLSAINLKANVPSSLPIQLITYEQPRMGNPQFSDWVGQLLGTSFVRIANYNDIVPRLPGTFLGYQQTITEFWLDESGQLNLCPGVENENCSAGISDFDLSADPHSGPFYGVTMNDC